MQASGEIHDEQNRIPTPHAIYGLLGKLTIKKVPIIYLKTQVPRTASGTQ